MRGLAKARRVAADSSPSASCVPPAPAHPPTTCERRAPTALSVVLRNARAHTEGIAALFARDAGEVLYPRETACAGGHVVRREYRHPAG